MFNYFVQEPGASGGPLAPWTPSQQSQVELDRYATRSQAVSQRNSSLKSSQPEAKPSVSQTVNESVSQ